MDEKESPSSLEVLVLDTLRLSANALDLYGAHRKVLIENWREIFSMTVNTYDGVCDWGQVRELLWSKVHRSTMTDVVFRRGFDSILIELYGPKEGVKGSKVIFTAPYGYSQE